MRIATLSIGLLALALTGCGIGADSSAVDELLLSSVSGEEDYLAGTSRSAGEDGAAGDRSAPPPMFRECDAEGTFVGLFDAYDEDHSGELEAPEEGDVIAEHGGRPGGPRMALLHMLHLVYDVDMDRSFDADEQALIFDDFTARCETIHAEVLAEFDADGSGDLDEEEQEAAGAAHRARMEAEREAMDACRESCEGGGPLEAGGGPPDRAEGERGEGPPMGEDGAPPWGPLEEEFDADGDGALSDDELATLRTEMRERIRSADRPHPDCG